MRTCLIKFCMILKGEDGAFKMLRLLTDELKTAMTFCGTRRISDIR